MSSSCTLHIAVDADLSVAYNSLIAATQSPKSSALFSHLPPRTKVLAERGVNAVAQTVVLTLQSAPALGNVGNGDTSPRKLDVSPFEKNIYAVLMLDVQQVPPLLSAATAHSCPPHPSGADPLGWYLDAVVDGLLQERMSIEQQEENSRSTEWKDALQTSPLTSPITTTTAKSPHDVVVHLSLVVVPNATSSLDGLNITNVNVTTKEAATLFSAAAAWCAARQRFSTAATLNDTNTFGQEEKEDGDTALCSDKRELSCCATLDLCTTAAQPQQAIQMVAALGNKLLRSWSSTEAASAAPEALSNVDLTAVRPDTHRKCIPTDFHALYTSMLTEISSFSERKTIAAVTAFPTMCHLLEYVDGVLTHESTTTSRDESSTAVPAVHSSNYGEQRSWNVLNDAIIEAIAAEYDRA